MVFRQRRRQDTGAGIQDKPKGRTAAFWSRLSNAALSDNQSTFIITHPFSPLKGKEFKLIERKICWDTDRLFSFDENGNTCHILTAWTDYLPPDPFISIANGQVDFRYDDLVALKETLLMIDEKMSG